MSNKTAIIFPGQGAQFSGMGKELYETSPASKKIFDSAEALRKGTIEQCFYGTKEELSLTINTQPCIFIVSLASAYSMLEKGIKPQAAAGFSVGELAALTFAKVFSFENGFKAVIKRAELMHKAAQKHKGSMSAVLRLDLKTVIQLCKNCGVYAVNFNCPGQTVVSGEEAAMQNFNQKATEAGGRIMPLVVSGAFHSPLVADAAKEFGEYLKTIEVSPPKIPVYANFTALPYSTDSFEIKHMLNRQINSPVLWQQTVENMLKDEYDEFIEAEPGKILTGLIGKIKQ